MRQRLRVNLGQPHCHRHRQVQVKSRMVGPASDRATNMTKVRTTNRQQWCDNDRQQCRVKQRLFRPSKSSPPAQQCVRPLATGRVQLTTTDALTLSGQVVAGLAHGTER